jgi:hypothetical protein
LPVAISFDIAVESLHLRLLALTMSVGLMRPFCQVWACEAAGSGAEAGTGVEAATVCGSICFLDQLSACGSLTEIFACSTHFLRLLSPMTHLMPSMVQLEQVTSPSAVMWYLCITSHLTLRARQAAQALVARRLTGLGLPLASSWAAPLERFFEAGGGDAEDWELFG